MLLKRTISITCQFLLPAIDNQTELKDVEFIRIEINGRAIVVVVESTTFVYICQNVFDLNFANPHQIKININPD